MKYISILILIVFFSSCSVGKPLIEENTLTTQTNNMQIEDINENKEEPTISESLLVIEEKGELECLLFDDFTDISKNNWLMVNDGVMWGKSIGTYAIKDNAFTLSGVINTNGGWFSSVRAALSTWTLTEYNSIILNAKADSRWYQITFRDNNRRWISHRAILPFQTDDKFEEITIQISDLEPVYFWTPVNAAAFKKESAREIGFILNDGKDGKFQLEIDSIKFCK